MPARARLRTGPCRRPRRGGGVRRLRPAHGRRGGVALQPDRPARPRPLRPAPGASGLPTCPRRRRRAGLAEGSAPSGLVTVDGRLAHRRELGGGTTGWTSATARTPTVRSRPRRRTRSPRSTPPSPPPARPHRPGSRRRPVVVVHWISGSGVAAFPRLVLEAGADSDVAVLEVFVSDEGADALVVPVTHLHVGKAARVGHVVVQDLGLTAWQLATSTPRSTPTPPSPPPLPASAAPTPDSAPTAGSSVGADREPAGHLVRRGRPDPRLPHLPGARRPRHRQRPRLQGRRRRSEPQRLHRAHPGRRDRPGHRRPADQPQPQAVRRRLGRVGAQPRDPQQRRAVRPRLGGRARRRGAALVRREPRRAHQRGRAPHRGRVLRGGRRGPPDPGGRRRPLRAAIDGKLDRSGLAAGASA